MNKSRLTLLLGIVVPVTVLLTTNLGHAQKKNITDEDRKAYFGLIPAEWTRYEGDRQEERAKKRNEEQ